MYKWLLSIAPFRFGETYLLHINMFVGTQSAISPFFGGIANSQVSLSLALSFSLSRPLSLSLALSSAEDVCARSRMRVHTTGMQRERPREGIKLTHAQTGHRRFSCICVSSFTIIASLDERETKTHTKRHQKEKIQEQDQETMRSRERERERGTESPKRERARACTCK